MQSITASQKRAYLNSRIASWYIDVYGEWSSDSSSSGSSSSGSSGSSSEFGESSEDLNFGTETSSSPTPTSADYLYTIKDANLVTESITITEKLCSTDEIKFGLCEGAAVEFECFDVNIKKGQILNVTVRAIGQSDHLQMGWYEVATAAKQAATGIIKVTAYNKLQSSYLDSDASARIANMANDTPDVGYVTLFSIRQRLLADYNIIDQEASEAETSTGSTHSQIGRVTSLKASIVDVGSRYLTVWNQEIKFVIPSDKMAIFYFETYKNILEELWAEIYTAMFNAISYNVDQTFTSFYALVDFAVFGVSVAESDSYSSLEGGTPDAQYTVNGLGTYLTNSNDLDDMVDLYGFQSVVFSLPVKIGYTTSSSSITSEGTIWATSYTDSQIATVLEGVTAKYFASMDSLLLTKLAKDSISSLTLRDLNSAIYELACQFGQMDRETNYLKAIELNNGGLYPADTLYPAKSLYPAGAVAAPTKSQYTDLFVDDNSLKKFKYLIINFNRGDNETYTMTKTVNSDGNTNYNITDNWLLNNLEWTYDSVEDFAAAMIEKMKDITWVPFDMDGAGMPWLEPGDMIEVATNSGTFNTYILGRTMKGLRHLEDNFTNGTVETF